MAKNKINIISEENIFTIEWTTVKSIAIYIYIQLIYIHLPPHTFVYINIHAHMQTYTYIYKRVSKTVQIYKLRLS